MDNFQIGGDGTINSLEKIDRNGDIEGKNLKTVAKIVDNVINDYGEREVKKYDLLHEDGKIAP
ncbi:MAG: hypothetical protein LBK94_05740 [Prevotellaceae bacterium]|jgi:hypothetical protein|nr:hypothetical protein [Prevotellaceae bacterium]